MSLKAFRRWQARIGLSFAAIYIKKIIFIIKWGFHKGNCLLVIIWLCLWFSSIFFGEISQNFHKLWKLSWQSFKSWGLEKPFSCYLQFCVFFLYLKFGLMNFFLLTGIRKDTNMPNGPANLRKFHWRKCHKFYLKDPYFLCCKTLRNRMEICQDWYLSMRRLLNHGSWVFIWYVYFGLAKFLDIEHKHYWTLVALYSVVVLGKIIRYISLSDLLWGILASIIEMLQYGKYNSHSACHLVIIVVKIKTIHIYHTYKINIPWDLVQMFVCQQLEFLEDF